MTHAEKEVRNQKIVELREQGYSQNQIAERFELSRSAVVQICKRYNVSGVMSGRRPQEYVNQNTKRTEEEARQYVESFLGDSFSYVGGYIDCEHKVTIRCNKCGCVFERSMISIRKNRKTRCDNCIQVAADEKREAERNRRIAAKLQRQSERDTELFLSTYQAECEVCGKIFITRNQRQLCCSKECSQKKANSYYSKRKDKRLTKEKRVDSGITARKLFRRDSGVCWICGGLCDLNDYIVRDNTTICGDLYPSVDHVVAVCDGGEDSWDNVRLAHRICNTKRYWESIRPSPGVASA